MYTITSKKIKIPIFKIIMEEAEPSKIHKKKRGTNKKRG